MLTLHKPLFLWRSQCREHYTHYTAPPCSTVAWGAPLGSRARELVELFIITPSPQGNRAWDPGCPGAPCTAPSLSLGLSLPCRSTGWGLGQGFAVPLPRLGSAPRPAWPGAPSVCAGMSGQRRALALVPLAVPAPRQSHLLSLPPGSNSPYPQPRMTSAALNPPVDLSLLLFPQQRGQCLDSVG